MRTTLSTLLVLLLFTPAFAQPSAATAGLSEEGLARYQAWLEGEVEAHRLPMAEALIYRNGELGFHTVVGQSDLEKQTPLRENQVYQLMSMTKPIITVAAMMLYEEGHFQLSDEVANYLPEFSELKVARSTGDGIEAATEPAKTKITIAQVMSHTAGFSHGLEGTTLDNEIAMALYFQPQADITSRVATLASLPLVNQPGEAWYYSASPDIVSRLIEVFSGMTTADFLQQRLFEPLGMKDTGYNLTESQATRMVANHEAGPGTLAKAARQLPTSGVTVYGGSHGLLSTAQDYLRFARMLLNNGELDGRRYLSRKTVELMTVNHVGEMRGNGQGFGLGFGIITDVAASDMLGSAGQYFWNGAYSTFFFIDPEEDLISILMSQRSPYSNFHEAMIRQMTYQALAD